MSKAPERDQEILTKVKAAFEADACSVAYTTWFQNAVSDYLYYDGHQWSDEDKAKLAEMSITPVTVNKIAPRLDNVAGQEVQSRSKVIYRARSDSPQEKETAEALSDLAMFVEEKNDSTRILSKVSDDARKCGLGWHEFDVQDNVILERARNPLEVVFDVRDRTPGLTDPGRLSVMNWMKEADADARFEEFQGKWDQVDFGFGSGISLPEAASSLRLASGKSYRDQKTGEVCIIEHHWREPCEFYEVVTRDERQVITFSKKEAWDIARSTKRGERDITTKQGFKVFIAYFTGNTLLEYNEDFYQLDPARGRFMLSATVCFRERITGIPYGLVRRARDPQDNYNKNRTRLKWLQSANQVIAEAGAAKAEVIRREAARADGVLWTTSGKKLEINRHESAIAQHLAVLQQDDKDIQDTLGIYDENLGKETNVSSGVGIQRRQAGGDRNTAMIRDNASAARKIWGQDLLCLVQTVFTEQIALWVLDDEEASRALVLNQPVVDSKGQPQKDAKGRVIVKRDIKTGTYDAYVEEIPDVATQTEYARDMVLQAVQAVGMQGLTPGLLEILGVPKSAKLMKEIQDGLPQEQAAATAAAEAAAIPDRNGNVVPMPTGVPGRGQPPLQPMGRAQ